MADKRLSLDHITVTDTTPWQLAQIAAEVGCEGICTGASSRLSPSLVEKRSGTKFFRLNCVKPFLRIM